MTALAGPPFNNPSLRDLLDEFGPVEQNPALGVSTEYPGFAYRLELLVSTLTFHLSKDKWLPGKVDVRFILRSLRRTARARMS